MRLFGRRGGRKEELRSKVASYYRSKLFPWNFIFEDVDKRSLEHFMSFAAQAAAGVVPSEEVSKEDVLRIITEGVRSIVNNFLLCADDADAVALHGRFASDYPFAMSQCFVYAVLSTLSLKLEDVVDINNISDLLGADVRELRRKEEFLLSLAEDCKRRNPKILGASLLGRKVLLRDGTHVGRVEDIIFDSETRSLELRVNTRLKDFESVPFDDVRLNLYNGSVVVENVRKGT
ncbi:MAG: PRC-barrel domain containing protein [Candidatus Alkanophagales archaeon]